MGKATQAEWQHRHRPGGWTAQCGCAGNGKQVDLPFMLCQGSPCRNPPVPILRTTALVTGKATKQLNAISWGPLCPLVSYPYHHGSQTPLATLGQQTSPDTHLNAGSESIHIEV